MMALVSSGCAALDVLVISGDATGGRNNGTAGWQIAQDYIIDELAKVSTGPMPGGGDDAYRQPMPGGVNVIGMIAGSDLSDEYVVVGAHYDHIGTSCPSSEPGDNICNGATDNAAGVAAMLEVARAVAAEPVAPRRSIIFAAWDREEDGLLGSLHYVNNPVAPIADTVAYINFDILGSNLSPSLANTSFAIASETGGPQLTAAVTAASGATSLNLQQLSSVFGQGRSDYARFTAVGVPSVFFTDSTGPCYHTAQDDLSVTDFDKLDDQIAVATALTMDLANTTTPPSFTSGPAATFGDAQTMLGLLTLGQADLGLYSPGDQVTLTNFLNQLTSIVNDGPAAFGGADINTLLLGSLNTVSILTTPDCDGFLN